MGNEKYEMGKEALWAISNATSGGSDAQITYLVNQGVIPPLCKFLNFEVIGMRKKILLVALEGSKIFWLLVKEWEVTKIRLLDTSKNAEASIIWNSYNQIKRFRTKYTIKPPR